MSYFDSHPYGDENAHYNAERDLIDENRSLRSSYDRYVAQASARIAELEVQLAKQTETAQRVWEEHEKEIDHLEAQLAEPHYCCLTCGSTGPFEPVVYESLDGTEYDMECTECGSKHIEEGYSSALRTLAQKVDDLEAQLAAVPKWTRITDDEVTWPPKDDKIELLGYYTKTTWAPRIRTGSHAISTALAYGSHVDYFWRPFTPPQVEP